MSSDRQCWLKLEGAGSCMKLTDIVELVDSSMLLQYLVHMALKGLEEE